MDFNEKYYIILAMRQFGGSFVQNLASALEAADPANTAWIEKHLQEQYPAYMPGGRFYSEVCARERKD